MVFLQSDTRHENLVESRFQYFSPKIFQNVTLQMLFSDDGRKGHALYRRACGGRAEAQSDKTALKEPLARE